MSKENFQENPADYRRKKPAGTADRRGSASPKSLDMIPVRRSNRDRNSNGNERPMHRRNAAAGAGNMRAQSRRQPQSNHTQQSRQEQEARRARQPQGTQQSRQAQATRRARQPQGTQEARRTGQPQGARQAGRSGRTRHSRRSLFHRMFPVAVILTALFVLFFIGRGILRMLPRKIGRDTEPPVIELTSDPDYVVYPGQEYKEEGYKATDDRDGDLTSQVRWTVEGNTIVYSVSDEAGNVATRTRQIPYAEVSANIAQDGHSAEELAKMRESFPDADETASGSGKVIYLTFDDGPGQYTERLLEILKRNDVHVTFFVTGAFPVYEDMIHKEYESGHSIGIHTLTHDFDKIYASTDAFWKDNNEMQEVVVRQTGHATNLMRFAGGSSNSLGIWQSPGIMEDLVNQAQKKGFQYFDWNVSSGDGAAEGDSAMVISRITEQVQNYDTSVVLCHDTKEYTVNAMEYLIPWLLDNGYEIRPLSVDSFPAHHMEPD